MMKSIKTLLDIIGQAKIIIDVIIPVLETILNSDLNKDGKIGNKKK